LIQQHDKHIDAAKVRCEEAKNLAQVVQSELEVARKEKTEAEARLKILQRTAQSETFNVSEIDRLKKRLQEKVEELHKRTEEFVNLERTHADLVARNANIQIAWEQQAAEVSQHSSVIERLRQETDAEFHKERDKSKTATDLAQTKMRILEQEKIGLQAKLEQAQLLESEMNKTYAALVAERDGLRSRADELEAAKEISATEIVRIQEEKTDIVTKYEERLDVLHRQHERSDAALNEAEARVQLQKTEHHKKIEFDRQKYESIVQVLTNELNKTKTQATSRPDDQQQAQPTTAFKLPLPQSEPNKQVGKTRKKVSRENNSVLDVAELSGSLISTSSVQGVTTSSRKFSRSHHQDLDQGDNLFEEEHKSFGKDIQDRNQSFSVVDPAAESVEDAQDVDGTAMPHEDTAEQVSQDTLRATQYHGQVLFDDSSLSAPLESNNLGQLFQNVQAVRTPMGPKHRLTRQSSQEHVPETPIRSNKSSLSGSQSSHSHGRPGSQANTASRLMHPPGSLSPHFGENRPSPTGHSMGTSRQHTYAQINHGEGPHYGTSSSFGNQHPPVNKVKYDHRAWTRNVWGSPGPSQSQKRKQTFDQEAPSKRKQTPSQTLSHSPSPSSRPSPPHQSKSSSPSAAVGRTRPLIPSLLPSVSPADQSSRPQLTSSDIAHRSYDRAPSTNPTTRLRKQRTSASRSSVSARPPYIYGRPRTRSESKFLQ
jgi:hypothetical protein